jgi:cytochrome c nitrite reductase small subunit
MTTPTLAASVAATPNRRARLAFLLILVGMFGAILGLGTFTVIHARGFSYLSDDANACVNCHVMRDQFDAWNHSSHKAVATCNDCHTSHQSIFAKYLSKAVNGFNHSLAFTTGNFPEPIRITERNRNILLENCVYCHASVVSMMGHVGTEDQTDCLRCHARVGHETR